MTKVQCPGGRPFDRVGCLVTPTPTPPAWASGRELLCSCMLAVFFFLSAGAVRAQELEPRAYSNLPIGLNFAVVAYAYSEGGLATDPSLPLEDAHLQIHTTALAFSHSLNLHGNSGRFDLILPISDLSGTARANGAPASRDISGLNDPRLRLAVNFYGAPAGDL